MASSAKKKIYLENFAQHFYAVHYFFYNHLMWKTKSYVLYNCLLSWEFSMHSHCLSVCVCVRECSHLGIAGTRVPFSSVKCPPALSTHRWWRDMRAWRAVVGLSFPSWLSAFFSGENSSSLSTSYTTNFLGRNTVPDGQWIGTRPLRILHNATCSMWLGWAVTHDGPLIFPHYVLWMV